MNREILFRGKSIETKKWVYGLLFVNICGDSFITYLDDWSPTYSDPDSGNSTVYDKVYSDTLGQYTGRKDENGNKIFEGDIVKYHNWLDVSCDFDEEYSEEGKVGCVVYDEDESLYSVGRMGMTYIPYSMKVIGNIHDNPELLKSK